MRARCFVRLTFIWLALWVQGSAQDRFQSVGPEDADHFETTLKQAKSCAAAMKEFSDGRWGSSADAWFGRIPRERCERDFLPKLSSRQVKRYRDELDLCGYEYSRQTGTMFISESAMCAVDVAARYSANPTLARSSVPRASFDCAKVHTRLELAICSDAAVGRADLVLGRVYAPTIKSMKGRDRQVLIASERDWLRDLPARCELGTVGEFTTKALTCLRNEIEIRFTVLDGCASFGLEDCLDPGWEQEIRDAGRDEK